MAVDIRGLVGPENMTPEKKATVIQLLQVLPLPGSTRRYLYARWARLVSIQPLAADLNQVAPFEAGT
jgi:hypothetical protein